MPYNTTPELIAACLSGNASPEDEMELMAWRKADHANEQAFQQAKKAWELSASLAEPTVDFDSREAWVHVRDVIKGDGSTLSKRPATRQWLMMAAGIACLVAISITAKLLLKTHTEVPQQASIPAPAAVIAMINITANDSSKVFFLPDSSRVHLGSHSTLSYPATFGDSIRHTVLKGEAFFEVRRDTLHPFAVTAAGTRVQVLGTSFDVREDAGGKVSVIVVSGEVKFFPEGQPEKDRLLHAGDKGICSKGNISKSKNTDKDFRWWNKRKKENIIRRAIKNIRKKLK